MFSSKPITLLVLAVTINVAFVASMSTPNRPLSPRFTKSTSVRSLNYTAKATCANLDKDVGINNGIKGDNYRWKAFNVHPDKQYTQENLNTINNAMYKLMQVLPCVSFGIWPQNSQPSGDYVAIVKGTTGICNSAVGRQTGRQVMRLDSGCIEWEGTVIHEMIHALGFHHEQCRPDRDDYVDIHYENIPQDKYHNFDKLDSSGWETFGVAYNPQSIMHYGGNDFSTNGRPTITAKNGGAVGSQGRMMQTDIDKLKKMYKC